MRENHIKDNDMAQYGLVYKMTFNNHGVIPIKIIYSSIITDI